MADVPGKFFSATKVRTGVSPSSPGSLVGEPLPPVNPPGTSLNSVGLTMPSAFTVSNSPLTSNGTIGVAGAGTVGQYIRGDGSLADFPESSGGGSSVSYYLNGSVNQGTIGGVAYKELNKVPILGAGTDFTINADGYIASFITDAGDPNLLEIPAGNWNFETFFSASSGGGSPTFYVELYKVNSGGTATLIASNSTFPELIAFGTNVISYFSTLAVPTTALSLTDRLAIRYYVIHSGRTITLHTEDNHLCQIITTFTTGITALNGLTAQVQNFAVGTSGTDFAIASATATHTFNLPTASALNRGALSSADWTTFNNKQNALTLTTTGSSGAATLVGSTLNIPNYSPDLSGYVPTSRTITINGTTQDLSANRTFNVGTVTSITATAGTGISISGSPITSSGTLTITNTAPDQIVSLTASTGISISGTYPNFTITNTSPSSGGTVTSVTASSPLFSSGGNTPNITIQQASGSQSGFLSSTDWTTFNSKQNALTNPVTGTGTTNYLAKFTGASTIGNSLFTDNGTNAGYNNSGVAARTFIIQATSGRPLALEVIENTNVHAIYLYPNNAGFNRISSDYMSGGVFLPLSLTGRENNNDFVLQTNGNVTIGTTNNDVYKLDVNGTGRFKSFLYLGESLVENGVINSPEGIFINADSDASGGTNDIVFGKGRTSTSGGTTLMTIKNGGNVGIGAPTPSGQLHLKGASGLPNFGTQMLQVESSTDNYSGIVFSGTNGSNAAIRSEDASTMSFWTASGTSYTKCMTMTSSGNVLIGTTTDNGSRLRVNGSLALPHVTKSANYTLDTTDYTVGFDCASSRTANLPDATTCAGRIYVIYQYNTGSGARSVTLDGNGSQTINGATTYSLSPYCDFTSVMIQSNGSNWIVIADILQANCL